MPAVGLVAASLVMAVGVAISGGYYGAGPLAMVGLGVATLVLSGWAIVKEPRDGSPVLWFILAASVITVALLPVLSRTPSVFGSATPLLASRLLTAVGVTAVIPALFSGGRWHLASTTIITALGSAALVLVVVASARPANDVWFMHQAAARAVEHGQNFYTAHWNSGLPGESHDVFTYLPVSGLVLTPFHLFFGDVRYGLAAAVVATAVMASRIAGRRTGLIVLALVLFYPRVGFGVEQSWNDPLLLLGLAAMVLSIETGWNRTAIVAFGLVLATKQYVWLLTPIAAVWPAFGWRRTVWSIGLAAAVTLPFALLSPGAFLNGAWSYNFHHPASFASLSVTSLEMRHGIHVTLVVTALVTMFSVVWSARILPRTSAGFVVGSAIVVATFDLFNKQSFFNEWQLAAVLSALGAAALFGRPAPSAQKV